MRVTAVFLALVISLGLLYVYKMRARVMARPTASGNSCVNNLRQLEGAKEQWQLEHKLTNGSPAIPTEVLQYVKGGVMPICPQGGAYTIGSLGSPVACTIPTHKL
jgi:hypothetical protein